MEKKALFVLEDEMLATIFKVLFEKVGYKTYIVNSPKDAVEEITKSTYAIVLIGKNRGSIVKSKLADILYDKAFGFKPHIIIVKEPGDIVYSTDHITFIRKPSFHQDLLKSLSIIDENSKIKEMLNSSRDVNVADNFLKNKNYEVKQVSQFLKWLKGNKKFELICSEKKIVGFLMSNEIYILHSDFDNPYSVLSCKKAEIATEEFEIAEFLSLKLGEETFKTTYRKFILKSIESLKQEKDILHILPHTDSIISIKAPRYVLQQCKIVDMNFNIDWLESHNKKTTLKDIMHKYDGDIIKLKTIAAMYLLNMIEFSKITSHNNQQPKFDVTIKKSLLEKIMDKIRGL